MSPQLTCTHRCRCGAELHCGDPDRCPIGSREWLCEACELDAIDEYINRTQLETEPVHPTPQETR
jgi:hypothetical protein